MLAAASEHISWWMGILLVVFLFGWLWWGGRLFRKGLLKYSQKRQVSLGRGVWISFASGLIGAAAAGVMYLVGNTALPPPPESTNPVSVFGIVLAVPTFAIIAYLLVFSMFHMSAGKTLKACVPPLASTILLAGIISAACGWSVSNSLQRKLHQNMLLRRTMENFFAIYRAIELKDPTDPPASLEDLLDVKGFKPKFLRNPVNPSGRGYFYVPAPLTKAIDKKQKFLVCTFRDDSVRDRRVVLFVSDRIEDLGERAFQDLLRNPVNEEFAEALRKAEGA